MPAPRPPPGTYWFLQMQNRDVLGFPGCPAHGSADGRAGGGTPSRPGRPRLPAGPHPPESDDSEDGSFLAAFGVHESPHGGVVFLGAS